MTEVKDLFNIEEDVPKFFKDREQDKLEQRAFILENELKKQEELEKELENTLENYTDESVVEELPLEKANKKVVEEEAVEEMVEEPVEEEEVKEDTVKYTLKLGDKYINRVRFETDEMLAILLTGNPDLAHKFTENELKGKLLEYLKDLGVKAMVSKTIYEEVEL